MRRAFVLALAVATTAVASRGARAQCSGGKQTKINAFTITPVALALPTATGALFNAGWSQSSYTVTVTPQTGQQWFLCVASASVSMGTVNGYTKPLADLEWSLNGTTWTSFTYPAQQPITNNSGARTLTLYIRTRLQYADDIPLANMSAGTYAANLTFTVSM